MRNTKGIMKIAILGVGNLGSAIARGIEASKILPAEQIYLTTRRLRKRPPKPGITYSFSNSNVEAATKAEIIFLCVQPKQAPEVLQEISPVLVSGQTIVSVVAGFSIDSIASFTENKVSIIRAMPNTAISIQESMTCLAVDNSEDSNLEVTRSIFERLGEVLVIEERLMQAATVLGASGIAFFMRYLRAATQGGIQMGFHPDEAQKIAVQTAKGAATLILENQSHPELEIDRVTTPQGCTIEGLNEMEHRGFSSSLIKGLMTSFKKINTISREP